MRRRTIKSDRLPAVRRLGAVDFARFDGARLAVLLHVAGARVILKGTASFLRDDELGRVLRICCDGAGNPE